MMSSINVIESSWCHCARDAMVTGYIIVHCMRRIIYMMILSSDCFLQEGHADADSVATAIDTYNGIAVSPLFTA